MNDTTKTRAEKIKETKIKKAAEAEAARIEGLVMRDLERLMNFKENYANPLRTFKVGDKVIIMHSNLRDAEVVKVIDGLFYRVKYKFSDKTGTQIKETHRPWTELLPEGATFRNESFNKRAEMMDARVSFHNCNLDSLVHKYYFFGVDMNPEYQRGFVWTMDDKIKLIESIFDGVEIGKFAFVKLPWKDSQSPGYEILDGKQRLSCLMEFMADRFAYKGVYYSQLSFSDKHYFCNFNITSGEAEEGTTLKQKLRYFLKMNTGGRPQDPAHMEGIRQRLAELEEQGDK